jgi:hypothetical protein
MRIADHGMRNGRVLLAGAAAGLGLVLTGAWGLAQEGRLKQAPKPATSEQFVAMAAEREMAAMDFVREHHPELSDLLAQLKSVNPNEYHRATLDLARTSERLRGVKDRDPPRYELELRAWQLDSQIRLLSARLTMADNPALIEELKDLMLQRDRVQRAQQVLERQRLAARLEKLDAVLEKTAEEREQQVTAQLERLLSGIQDSRPKGKAPRARPANNPPPRATSSTPKKK